MLAELAEEAASLFLLVVLISTNTAGRPLASDLLDALKRTVNDSLHFLRSALCQGRQVVAVEGLDTDRLRAALSLWLSQPRVEHCKSSEPLFAAFELDRLVGGSLRWLAARLFRRDRRFGRRTAAMRRSGRLRAAVLETILVALHLWRCVVMHRINGLHIEPGGVHRARRLLLLLVSLGVVSQDLQLLNFNHRWGLDLGGLLQNVIHVIVGNRLRHLASRTLMLLEHKLAF